MAGVVLADSFALLALAPVIALRETAVLVTIGLLIDTLVLRMNLVPALVTLSGERSGWPGQCALFRLRKLVDAPPRPFPRTAQAGAPAMPQPVAGS